MISTNKHKQFRKFINNYILLCIQYAFNKETSLHFKEKY